MGRPGPKSFNWRPPFLRALARTGNISHSSRLAGVSRQMVAIARKNDTRFDRQCRESLEEASDVLHAEAWRRAVEGIEVPVSVGGEIEIVRRYSDGLLMFLMKSANPQRFGDRRKVEHSGSDAGRVSGKSPEEIRQDTIRRLRLLLGRRTD